VANLLSDVRFCLRGFARRPIFAFVVVATLALGISVNAAIFSVYDQMLLRELPVRQPDGLVNLSSPGFKQGNTSCNDGGTCDEIFSYPMFRDLERADGPFVGIAAHRYTDASLAFEGSTATGSALLVSGQYFSLLGIAPAVGRLLDANDDRVDGEANAVVLTYAYWESAFGADRGVVGRSLVVNGKPLTIVGVGPRGFYGSTVGERPLVFVPITFKWLARPTAFPQHADRKSYWAYLFARVKPGVSLDEAAAAINAPYRAIVNDVDAPLLAGVSEQQLAAYRAKTIVLTPGGRGQSRIDDNASTPLKILIVSTGLVLLIACVNVANLLLARGSTRVGEIAVRASLGASRRRLLSLLLVETLLLAAAAALVSTPLTMSALRGIEAMLPPSNRVFDLTLDGAAVAATIGLAVLSTLVFGLIPALKLMRVDVTPAHQMQSTRQTGGKAAARFRATLTTAQIALSMALLVLSGWFAQSLANVGRVDLGFRAESLAVFTIAPERNGYSQAQSAALFTRLEEEFAQIPGVAAAGAAGIALLDNSNWHNNVSVEGFEATPETDTDVSRNVVSPQFFRTLEMPLIRGTGFERASSDGARVAVVNERFVEKFGLGDDAVGKRMAFGATQNLDIEIVGVVRDARYSEVKADPPPQAFVPRVQAPFMGEMNFYLRSNLGLPELRSAVMEVLARHDANLPLVNVLTVTQQARENVFLDRFMGTLAGALAAMAIVLAAVGIYGVLSYGVVQRLREIGLRIALGAAPQNVRGMVLKQVAWMAAVGIVVGVGLASLLGAAGRALFFGLAPTDPLVPAVAVSALILVVLAAGYLPARRAAHVDPVTALRGD
jgi:putative ABC transport system permease protein